MDFGGDIGKNIIEAFKILGIIMAIIGGLFLGAFIITLVLGTMFYAVQGGNIPVTNASNTTLTSIETGFNSNVSTIVSAAGFAGQLITVAIILLVFAGIGIWGYQKYKGNKSSGGY